MIWTELTSAEQLNPSTDITTASISPAADRAILYGHAALSYSAGAPAAPNISGNGITPLELETQVLTSSGSVSMRLSLWGGTAASPSAGVVTVACTCDIHTLFVFQSDAGEVDLGFGIGSAIVQAENNTGESASASDTLAAFANALNGLFSQVCAFTDGGDDSTTLTVESGAWTAGSQRDPAPVGPAYSHRCGFRTGEDTSPSWTLGASRNWITTNLEIAAIVSGGPVHRLLLLLGIGK